MGEKKIKISKSVADGIEFVRSSGDLNMFDYHGVMKMANDNGYYETVLWMFDNKKLYGELIFRGFEVE